MATRCIRSTTRLPGVVYMSTYDIIRRYPRYKVHRSSLPLGQVFGVVAVIEVAEGRQLFADLREGALILVYPPVFPGALTIEVQIFVHVSAC